jgi:hypothetical protein
VGAKGEVDDAGLLLLGEIAERPSGDVGEGAA